MKKKKRKKSENSHSFKFEASIHFLLSGDRFKSWNMEGVLHYLKKAGHEVNTSDSSRADVNVAQNYHNVLRAHSDTRRGGSGSALY